ncbi:MAG: glycosyltransferase family 2 protein [Bdellovibrionales bacterium]|nr:glycosyltransferase family 2 protein [Bdellovibrionales bacterium]
MEPRGPNPTITVAIPTLGRFEEVRDTLESILAGSRLPDEIIVSDQNVPSREDLDAYLKRHAPGVRHLRTEPKGVVFNMNRLLREAKSDIILYLDDDVIPSPRLVEAHLQNYSDPSVRGVAGRVEQPTGDIPPDSFEKVGRFNRWTGAMTFRFNGKRRQRCVFAQGANMSFDRRSLAEIGGFDEGFGGNGYFFESDATLRLVKRFPGCLIFDPDASLKHLAAPRGGARVHDRAIHHSFVTHNGIRLFRRHSPKISLAFIVLKIAGTTLAKSAYRHSPRIASLGLKALFEALLANQTSPSRE